MIRASYATTVLAVCLAGCGSEVATNTGSQPDSTALEGGMRYTPTRLEWLAIRYNSSRHHTSIPDGIDLAFHPVDDSNTILMLVRYLPDMDRDVIHDGVEQATKIIRNDAKTKGWASWLKVETDVEPLNPANLPPDPHPAHSESSSRPKEVTTAKEGGMPYIPTRLEWLSLTFNARYGHPLRPGGFQLACIPENDTNAIRIYVRYYPDSDRAYINHVVEHSRDILNREARERGWDSWLEIEEDVEMIEYDVDTTD